MAPELSDERRVLVIDDEEIIRDSVSTYLEDSGFVVFQARDGQEGLEMFREKTARCGFVGSAHAAHGWAGCS